MAMIFCLTGQIATPNDACIVIVVGGDIFFARIFLFALAIMYRLQCFARVRRVFAVCDGVRNA